MQTYTHYVMTAVLNRQLKARERQGTATQPTQQPSKERVPPVRSGWLMLGSVMPDIPLILIFIGTFTADLIQGNILNPGNENTAVQSYTGYLFRVAFFQDPWVKLAHNLFHAPLMILFYIIIGYWLWKRRREWGAALFWFGIACALHTTIDIPVHYDDGPLIFFPFDWETRFYGPISYWEQGRGGRWFTIFEHLLLLGMLLYLGITWWRNHRIQHAGAAAPDGTGD